jgi:hypothetical protein
MFFVSVVQPVIDVPLVGRMPPLLAAHVIVTVPWVIRTVSASLETADRAPEEAARGWARRRRRLLVTLPITGPASPARSALIVPRHFARRSSPGGYTHCRSPSPTRPFRTRGRGSTVVICCDGRRDPRRPTRQPLARVAPAHPPRARDPRRSAIYLRLLAVVTHRAACGGRRRPPQPDAAKPLEPRGPAARPSRAASSPVAPHRPPPRRAGAPASPAAARSSPLARRVGRPRPRPRRQHPDVHPGPVRRQTLNVALAPAASTT